MFRIGFNTFLWDVALGHFFLQIFILLKRIAFSYVVIKCQQGHFLGSWIYFRDFEAQIKRNLGFSYDLTGVYIEDPIGQVHSHAYGRSDLNFLRL